MVRLKRVYESNLSPDSVELGGYTWTKIGELKGYSLYLCDKIVKRMMFNKSGDSNEWRDSDIRKWLNSAFYSRLTPEEKSQIVPFEGDKLFLLSQDEYYKFNGYIDKKYYAWWWLRSSGFGDNSAALVRYDEVYYFSVNFDDRIGVRPAVLLKD